MFLDDYQVVTDKQLMQYLLVLRSKLEVAPRLLKILESECPDVWMLLPRHKWPKSWRSIEDPVVPLERNLYGHPLAGLRWEIQFEEALVELGWEKNELVMFVRSSKAHVATPTKVTHVGVLLDGSRRCASFSLLAGFWLFVAAEWEK